MKKRFLKWFTHLFVRYIPSSKKICSLEAKRIAIFITDNYDYSQHDLILNYIKHHLTEYSKNEILRKMEDIEMNKIDINTISENLEKFTK